MSDDLGDFLKEAARRRKERRERQETPRAQPTPREMNPERSVEQGTTEVRRSFAEQAEISHQPTFGEVEAARQAARERAVERVGFAERSAAEAKRAEAKTRKDPRAALSATPSPIPGAFSQPQAVASAAPSPEETDAQALMRLLRSPGGVRQAFILSEILRPKHLDF